jgi:hypothetical protein
LITATFGASARSAAEKGRPATIGMSSVVKKSSSTRDDMTRTSAASSASRMASGATRWISSVSVFIGTIDVSAADVTPGSASARSFSSV